MNYDDGNDGDYYGDDSDDDDPTPLFLEDFLIPVHLCYPMVIAAMIMTIINDDYDEDDGDDKDDDNNDHDDPAALFSEDFSIPVHLPHPICLPRITSLVPKTVSSFQFTCYQLAKFLIYLKRATQSSLVQTETKNEIQPKIGENIAKGTTDPRH